MVSQHHLHLLSLSVTTSRTGKELLDLLSVIDRQGVAKPTITEYFLDRQGVAVTHSCIGLKVLAVLKGWTFQAAEKV